MIEIKKEKSRKTYIDFIKIIAIFMIMFNHTSTKGFVLFTVKQDSPLFLFYLFNGIFIKIGVPLFLMASGALLLAKEESIKQLLKNRFLKYLIVLVVCSAIQYLYTTLIINHSTPSIFVFLIELYVNRLAIGYWYLYMYLAYILMLPFLRRLAKAMSNQHYLWMFLLMGFINFLTILDYLVWQGRHSHNSYFSFFITTTYIFYPLMGYYIDRMIKEKWFNWKGLILLIIASVAAILICCFMTIYHCKLIGEWKESSCQTFFNTLIFLPTITIFYAAKLFFAKHPPKERVCRLLGIISGTTFGIFLFENILRERTISIFNFLQPYIGTLPACWIWILSACILGFVFIFLIKLIPGVKKFI